MPEVWPIDLPQQFRVEGYSESLGDGRVSTRPEIGPPMSRRRSTAVVRPLAHTMKLTGDQLQSLLQFVAVTILGGTLPFTYPSPRGGPDWLVKFDEGGLPDWRAARNGQYFVSVKWLVLP